jgi:hypothetical protein
MSYAIERDEAKRPAKDWAEMNPDPNFFPRKGAP